MNAREMRYGSWDQDKTPPTETPQQKPRTKPPSQNPPEQIL